MRGCEGLFFSKSPRSFLEFVRAYAGAEYHWRPIESTSPAQPKHGIFKKLILRRAIQNLAAVAHVGIDHPVFCIDPRHGNISSAQRVLESQRIIRGSKCHQDLDVWVLAGAGLPAIPLV